METSLFSIREDFPYGKVSQERSEILSFLLRKLYAEAIHEEVAQPKESGLVAEESTV
ncbi:hypothetical protein ACFWFU_36075 [Streptomyces sp. NPDC060235]|uniref:hypothetical protein n=1 Tax=Streptomyces sp. NPDC060235 TaxID=3347080 RepID=UPI003662746B